MIDWSQTTNGKFEALISSISIQCADPTPPSSNATSYVYATNTSSNTPGINFSSASTFLDGYSASSSGNGIKLAKEIGIGAGVGVFFLIVIALVVRSCMQASRRKTRAAATTSAGFGNIGAQSYRPINDSTTNLETHAMPDRGYQASQYSTAPPTYNNSSPYGGGQVQYSSQPQFHRY